MKNGLIDINIWYGREQYFGKQGNPQRWVNILGNVINHHYLYNLVYVLNGKRRVPLPVGPSAYRLMEPGDFNIEIDREMLQYGKNTVLVIAKDIFGNETEREIVVNYENKNSCTLPFLIDWNNVSSIQDVTSVVDGRWALQKDGVRPVQIGYDRLVAIGDMTWRDYEAIVEITINKFSRNPLCFDLPSAGPGVGIMLRWKGHYNANDIMPRREYRPFGAIGWYKYGKSQREGQGDYRLEIMLGTETAQKKYRDPDNKKLVEGKTYIFKFRVETRKEKTCIYRLKVWEREKEEPEKWDLETGGVVGGLDSGSMLFIAHHCDAVFGRTHVRPIVQNLTGYIADN